MSLGILRLLFDTAVMRVGWFCSLAASLLIVGCASVVSSGDAGTDAATDASADASTDAATDGAVDGGQDASTPECIAASDCRLFSSNCDTCSCIPLPTAAPDPECMGTMVSCIIDPCQGRTASCDQEMCSVAN